MNRGLLVGLVAGLFAVPAWAAKPDPKAFGWYVDYAQAKAEAKRSGKPLLVVFRCEP